MLALVACRANTADRQQSPAASVPAVSGTDSPESSVDASASAAEPGSKGYLWKISGSGNPGYLVGTIHIARQAMYPLDPDLDRAIEASDFIALELDLTKVDESKVLASVNEKALLKDGTTLKDHVAEDDYEKFSKMMKKTLGAGAKMFDQYEPWYGAMMLESLPAMRYMLTDGIDKHIAKRANKDGKTIIELESMESQLSLFDGFTDELQKLYFHQTVEGASMAAIGLKQMLDMWTLGDQRLLSKMLTEYESQGKETMGELFDDYNGAFLVDRNERMAEQAIDYLANGQAGTYMFAVGALHMVGEHGLVALLEKAGYTVEFVD